MPAVVGDNLVDRGIQNVELTMKRSDVTSCDNIAFGASNVLDDAINVAGVPPDIDHVIVAAPKHEACSRSGAATTAGPGPGRVILNGNIHWRLIAHEMLHNLGAQHAGACNPGFPGTACGGNDYGDVFDIMGASTGSQAGFPSSWIQVRNGILPPSAERIVDSDGTYTINAGNDTAAGGIKLLMVPRGGAGDYPYYALETRIRRSYDDFLPSTARLYNGVSVRLASRATGPPGPPPNTQLVPAHPDPDRRNWPLAQCETFTDTTAGVSLRVVQAGGGTARVQVALGGRSLPAEPSSCHTGDQGGGGGTGGEPNDRNSRSLALAARQIRPRTKRVRRGSRVVYRVVVRNRDRRLQRARVCVRVPKRHLMVKGRSCKLIKVRSRKSARLKFVLRPRPHSRKRAIKVVFVAKTKNAKPVREVARLRL